MSRVLLVCDDMDAFANKLRAISGSPLVTEQANSHSLRADVLRLAYRADIAALEATLRKVSTAHRQLVESEYSGTSLLARLLEPCDEADALLEKK